MLNFSHIWQQQTKRGWDAIECLHAGRRRNWALSLTSGGSGRTENLKHRMRPGLRIRAVEVTESFWPPRSSSFCSFWQFYTKQSIFSEHKRVCLEKGDVRMWASSSRRMNLLFFFLFSIFNLTQTSSYYPLSTLTKHNKTRSRGRKCLALSPFCALGALDAAQDWSLFQSRRSDFFQTPKPTQQSRLF